MAVISELNWDEARIEIEDVDGNRVRIQIYGDHFSGFASFQYIRNPLGEGPPLESRDSWLAYDGMMVASPSESDGILDFTFRLDNLPEYIRERIIEIVAKGYKDANSP